MSEAPSSRGPGGPDDERRAEVRAALMKVLVVIVGIGVVVWIGSWVLVKGLGLDTLEAADGSSSELTHTPGKPLPSTALPVPEKGGKGGDDLVEVDDGDDEDDEAPDSDEIELNVSPLQARAMERINLTGQWPGHDNVGLLVQRKEDGEWRNFGVSAQLTVGTYSTYIQTGRTGEWKFRMYDPSSDTASNVVTVTIA